MTDIETTLEDCDHVLTKKEVENKIKELQQLLYSAQWEDAPTPPVFDISNGLVDRVAVGALMAKYNPYQSRPWKYNTTRLWNRLMDFDFQDWRDTQRYTFTKMCYVCECLLDDCQGGHEKRVAVTVEELIRLEKNFTFSFRGCDWNHWRLVDNLKQRIGRKAA